MRQRGFTIVELVVVIAIISTLLTIATINFNSWQRKNMVERYTKELYTDVQGARASAVYTKFRRGVVLADNSVTFVRYANDSDNVGTVLSIKQLPVAIDWSNRATPASERIDFNTRGVMTDPTVKVICFQTGEDASYDALIITPVLTSMGKVTNRGNACAQNNVTQK
jgi:prepilin-type N-terminal cleavage/methylation domain-containing protein